MELASYGILLLVVIATAMGLVRPGAGAALGLLVFAIEQAVASGIPLFVQQPQLWNQVSAVSVGVMLLSLVARGQYRLHGFFRPVLVTALAFIVYFVWASSWGPLPNATAMLVTIAPYVVTQIVLVPLLIQSEADLRAMARWVVILGSSIALVAVLHLDDNQNVARLRLGGAGSQEAGMNPMALSEACALAALVLALTARESGWWKTVTRWGVIVGCLTVAGLASRGEVVAVLVATVFALVMVRDGGLGQRGLRVMIVALLGVVSIYMVLETGVSVRYSAERLEGDASIRYFASSTMLSMFVATPEAWFRGLGTNYSVMLLGIYTHNQPIQALTEGGVLGIGLWLSVHGLAFRAYSQAQRVCTTPSSRFVLRVATALWIYFIVVGLKRGHVLDVWAISSAVILERCALVLRSEQTRLAVTPPPEGPRKATVNPVLARAGRRV
jgi:hypothetical protein